MIEVVHISFTEAQAIRDKAKDTRVVRLLDYYLSIHPKDKIPSRKDFDPFDIPFALPNLALVDVERNPYRFRFRVMGTDITYNMEFEGTGKYLDEVVKNPETEYPHTDRVSVVETGAPVYRFGPGSIAFRVDFMDLERVHLPFASDGQEVDMILSVFIYLNDQR